MRFLLECVGFGMMNTSDSDPSSPATPRKEAMDTRISRRRRRTSSPAEWKPSLFAISENINGPVRLEKAGMNRNRPAKFDVVKKTAGSWNVKRCAPKTVRVDDHARYRSRDFGHNTHPIVVPAFSAAPFTF